MQIAFVEKEDAPNVYHVLKHINFHKNKLNDTYCRAFSQGTCLQINYGNFYQIGSTVFQYMFEKLEGFQIRYNIIQPKGGTKKAAMTKDQRKDGYTHIREKGPRSNAVNEFMEWADEQTNEEGGPIHGWQEAKVTAALTNYMKGRQNAKVLTFWVLTLKDFSASWTGS